MFAALPSPKLQMLSEQMVIQMMQNYPLRQVYCTFTRTNESVSAIDAKYNVPLAAILSEIASLSDSAMDEYRNSLLHIDANLMHDTYSPFAIASQIKTSTMSIHNPLLRSLLSMLPAFLLYTSSADTLRVVDLSPREIDDYKSAILDNNGTLNIEKANANLSRWNERTTILRQVHSKNESYFQLVQLLTGKIDFTKLDAEAYCQLYSIRDAELDYMIHARATFTELKRIHDDFNSKNADIEKTASAYRQLSSTCTIVDPLSPQCPFHTKSVSQAVYAVSSLTALVALELMTMQQNGKELLRCSFCNRLFASYSSKSKYCPFPNPDPNYEGKTCREVAPIVEFANRERSAPFGAEFRKNYATYYRWIARNKNGSESMAALHSYLVDSYSGTAKECTQYADQQISEIQAEITFLFDQWAIHAKQALTSYAEGKISEQECTSAIQIPSVPFRSPLLACKHAEMRAYN